MEVLGIMGFIFAIFALSRVSRLERTLRANGIGRATDGLGRRLRGYVGEEVSLRLYTGGEEVAGRACYVLDADETWALILCDKGTKREKKLLIRLDEVREVTKKKEKERAS